MSCMQHPKLLTSPSLVTTRQNEQALLLSLLQDLSATPELLQLLNSRIKKKNRVIIRRVGLLFFFFVHCALAGAQSLSRSLEDCLTMAQQGSVTQQNARLGILAAQVQRGEAQTLWFPNVQARALGFQAFSPLLTIGLSDVLG